MDKSKISGIRFMFTITFFLQSSSLLTAFLNTVLKQDAWIAVALGIIACIPVIWFLRSFMLAFPDKNLVQVCELAYGKTWGKVVSCLFAWFFLTLSVLNVSDLGHFTNLTVMHRTPSTILILVCILISVWAVRYGLKVVTRYSAVFVFFEFFVLLVFFILIANQIDLKNFLPMFDQPFAKYIQGIHLSCTIPFGELVVMLMLTPNIDKKKITKHWFLGVGLGMVAVLGVLMRDIAILGNTMSLFKLPGLITIRLINLGEALSRMEILFALAMIILLFFKVTLLCYVTTVTFAYIFETKSFRHLALVTGVLIIAYIPFYVKTEVENLEFARRFAPFIWAFFEIFLPLVTLIIAKARQKLSGAAPQTKKEKVLQKRPQQQEA